MAAALRSLPQAPTDEVNDATIRRPAAIVGGIKLGTHSIIAPRPAHDHQRPVADDLAVSVLEKPDRSVLVSNEYLDQAF
jgi:hypothetical protein